MPAASGSCPTSARRCRSRCSTLRAATFGADTFNVASDRLQPARRFAAGDAALRRAAPHPPSRASGFLGPSPAGWSTLLTRDFGLSNLATPVGSDPRRSASAWSTPRGASTPCVSRRRDDAPTSLSWRPLRRSSLRGGAARRRRKCATPGRARAIICCTVYDAETGRYRTNPRPDPDVGRRASCCHAGLLTVRARKRRRARCVKPCSPAGARSSTGFDAFRRR